MLPTSSTQAPIPALANLLRSGQLETLLRQASDCSVRWPNSGPVWHLLGLAYLNLDRPGEAVAPLTRASKLLPKDAEILAQLGIAQMQSGSSHEASRSFERSLSLAPNQVGALINLANLANNAGKHAAAAGHCQRALRLAPGLPEALYNLGRALRGLNRKQDAIEAFRAVLAPAKDSAVAQNDVGLQLLDLEASAEAEACFRRAMALAPGYATAHSNLGRLLQAQGRNSEALAAFRQAAALETSHPAVHANLGSLYNALRQFSEGEAACRQAVSLNPALAIGYSNLANALVGQRRYAEAEAAFRRALELEPNYPDACNNLANLLQEQKRFDEAEGCYRRIKDDDGSALGLAYHCASHLCDWRRRERDEQALRTLLDKETTAISPFGLLTLPGADSAALQRRAGRLWATKSFQAPLAQPPLVPPTQHPAHDRLRIGYLSADFHEHATMHLLGGVLAAHDRSRFSIHLYSYGPNFQDHARHQAQESADIFRDIGALSDAAAAERIAADGIDILVDLKGYTRDSRLGITALRPAPLIVSWLGYPGTLGHERLADYVIGDPIVTPLEHAVHFSETLALLPHCYQPNDRRRVIGARPTRHEAGLPEEGFVFCSFNQSYKFNPETFDVWCRLLLSLPGSVLWLLQPEAQTIAHLRREATARGVAPERLVFAGQKQQAEHLGRLQLADLALDNFPVTSHTTASDALWVGVPLLTKTGDSFASRVAASLLHAVGLPELVTDSWEEYFSLAQALALGPARLAALRETLIARRLTAPLFDTQGFTQDLERLYQQLWLQHGEGRKTIVRLDPMANTLPAEARKTKL